MVIGTGWMDRIRPGHRARGGLSLTVFLSLVGACGSGQVPTAAPVPGAGQSPSRSADVVPEPPARDAAGNEAGDGGQDGGGRDSGTAGDASVDGHVGNGPTGADAGDPAGEDQGTTGWPCPAQAAAVDPLPHENQRTAGLVQGGFRFLEGPVWLQAQGWLLFSDMDFGNNQGAGPVTAIHRLDSDGVVSEFLRAANSNGLAIAADGRLLAATHDAQTLSLFDLQTKRRETLDLQYMGAAFNSPNDVAVRSDGTVYFTDPDWQLAPRTSEIGITGVYRVSPAGEVSLADGGLQNPNGITLSPDERVLYVSAYDGVIYRYDVAADGSTSGRTPFATGEAADGMAVDCAGNLYAAADGVQVFAPDGSARGSITVPETTTNVAFGGPDRRTLYVTAGTGLYQIKLNLPGSPY